MKTQIIRAAIVVILVAVVAACGGATATTAPGSIATPTAAAGTGAPAGGIPAATTTAMNACSLVTEQEATTLLGSDPGAGVNTSAGPASACVYGAELVVSLETGDGNTLFEGKKSALQGQPTFQTMDGLGDAAFATIVANTVADMEILKGSTLMSVMVQGNPSLQNITADALQKLGATSAGRF